MINENQLLEKFHIEELENRYEFKKWVSDVKVGVDYEGYGASVNVPVP